MIQLQEIVKIRKEIEIFRFRTKLLLNEKDRKSACIRQLKQTYETLSDANEETGTHLPCYSENFISNLKFLL